MLSFKVLINEDKVDSNFHKTCAKKFEMKNTFKTGVKYESLSDQQKHIVQNFKDHIKRPRRQILDNPQRVILNACAGSGKTVVARHLKKALIDRWIRDPNFDYLTLGYTGAAATALESSTIHSVFRIPTYYQPSSLPILLAKPMHENFRDKLKRVHIIIIDEYSLVGLRMFHFMDQMFRKADPEYKEYPFANRSVYLVGDNRQLSTIKDRPLQCTNFANAEDDDILSEASQVFHSFTTVYTLDKIYRQIGDNNEQFRQFLNRLRVGQCNRGDLELLRTRLHKNLPEFERDQFKNSLHIFSFRKDVLDHNMKMLYETRRDIVSIPNGLNGAELIISLGARVALTRNINISFNLVNGTIGDVVDIKYHSYGKVKYILVDFGSNYRGRAVAKTSRGQGIPIFPMTTQDLINGRVVSYKSFPLCLRWAATGHATQSKTLDRVAVLLGSYQFFSSMDYVLLTRARTLSSIMLLDSELPDNRLDYNTSRHRNAFQMIDKEDKRLELLAKNS